jgi:hypothetical protein
MKDKKIIGINYLTKVLIKENKDKINKKDWVLGILFAAVWLVIRGNLREYRKYGKFLP